MSWLLFSSLQECSPKTITSFLNQMALFASISKTAVFWASFFFFFFDKKGGTSLPLGRMLLLYKPVWSSQFESTAKNPVEPEHLNSINIPNLGGGTQPGMLAASWLTVVRGSLWALPSLGYFVFKELNSFIKDTTKDVSTAPSKFSDDQRPFWEPLLSEALV